MPNAPQTPKRMRVIGGIQGGALRPPVTPSRLEVTTTSTTSVTSTGTRTETTTVVTTVPVVDVSDFESDGECSNYFSDDEVQDGSDGPQAPAAAPLSILPPATSSALARVKWIKYYRPTPPSGLRKFTGPCYVLTCAQETGLFKYRHEVDARVAGLGRRAVWERRRDYQEGKQLYVAHYNACLVKATPLPNGPFAANPYDLIRDFALPVRVRNHSARLVPNPTDLRRDPRMYKFYVVTKGESVGIFGSWIEAASRVQTLRYIPGCPTAWKKYRTWDLARAAYVTAFNTPGGIQVTPVVGGPFDI